MEESKLNKPNTLFYLPLVNRFADNEWYIVHTLNSIFNTWQLDEYKKEKKDNTILDKKGVPWLIYYLDKPSENDICELIAWNESFEICMTREEY